VGYLVLSIAEAEDIWLYSLNLAFPALVAVSLLSFFASFAYLFNEAYNFMRDKRRSFWRALGVWARMYTFSIWIGLLTCLVLGYVIVVESDVLEKVVGLPPAPEGSPPASLEARRIAQVELLRQQRTYFLPKVVFPPPWFEARFPYIHLYPPVVFLNSFLGVFIGVFIQILWEEKPITEPI
jgi:hypothetical protein